MNFSWNFYYFQTIYIWMGHRLKKQHIGHCCMRLQQLWHTARCPHGIIRTKLAVDMQTTQRLSWATANCWLEGGWQVSGVKVEKVSKVLAGKDPLIFSARAIKSALVSICVSIFNSSYAQTVSSNVCGDVKSLPIRKQQIIV